MRTVTVDGSATVDDVVLEQILILFDFVVDDLRLPQRTTNHTVHL